MTILLKILGSVCVTMISSVTLGVPKHLVSKVGFIGFVSYSIYVLLSMIISPIIATFIACIVVSLMGQLFAREYKAPVTIFYIPAFFPFVPGSLIYQGSLVLIQGDAGSSYFFKQALLMAGAVALGVFIIDSCFDMYNTIQSNKVNKQKKGRRIG